MDFNVLFANATGASITPSYPMSFHHYLNVFCTANSLEPDATGVFAFWVARAIATTDAAQIAVLVNTPAAGVARDVNSGSGVAGDIAAAPRFCNGVNSYITIAQSETAFSNGTINEDDIAAARLFFSSEGAALGAFRDLVACHQVKPLSSENIENYFAMKGGARVSARVVKSMLDVGALKISKLAGNANLPTNPFMTYHLSASSTPQLVQRVMDDLGAVASNIFTAQEIAAVGAAMGATHDLALSRAIADRAIQVAYCYLEAHGSVPNNWYQGIKAMSSCNSAFRAATIAFFKKYAAVAFGIGTLDAQDTAALVLNAAPAGLMQGAAIDAAAVRADEARIIAMQAAMDAESLIAYNDRRAVVGQPAAVALPIALKASKKDARLALARDA